MATTQTAPKKKGLINFDFLQKLGKVLMTVIAVMPAAGLMISLGKLVQMSGGDIAAVMTIGTTTVSYTHLACFWMNQKEKHRTSNEVQCFFGGE